MEIGEGVNLEDVRATTGASFLRSIQPSDVMTICCKMKSILQVFTRRFFALSAVACENLRTHATGGTRGGCSVLECKIELTFVKLGAAYYGMCNARPSDTNNIEKSAVRTTRLGSLPLANYTWVCVSMRTRGEATVNYMVSDPHPSLVAERISWKDGCSSSPVSCCCVLDDTGC